MTDLTLYNPFKQLLFTDNYCFLCGQPVTPEELISVFPEWLLADYNLAQQEILLLDKSILPYDALTMPCCAHCQQHYLAPLEYQVQSAAAAGLAGWEQLPEKILFQWLGKIFYGLLVRELIAEQAPLVKPQFLLTEDIYMLDKMESFFKMLQSIRVPMVFADFIPASVFIVPLRPNSDNLSFEFRDDLHTMMISLQLGNVLLVCCLLDNGILKDALKRLWQPLTGKALHAKQAAEFSAQVYYAAYLFNVVPEYFIRPTKPGDQTLIVDTLIDDITASVFNPWQITGYAQMLEEMLKRWGITMSDILKEPGQPLSFLYDAEGNFQEDLES